MAQLINAKTFNEWNSLGRKIKKGSKAVSFNEEHQPLFTEAQTNDPNGWMQISNRLGVTRAWDNIPH